MLRFGLLALSVLVGGSGAFGEEVADYARVLPGTEAAGSTSVVVRDERTRRPLDGVAVEVYAEDTSPMAVTPPLLARTLTDEFGVASLAIPKGTLRHWVFRRHGYAPLCVWGDPEGTVELEPGREIGGRIVDELGRPLGGADVAVVGNCEHGPVLAAAVTNDDGEFRLGRIAMTGVMLLRSRACRLTEGDWIGSDRLVNLGERTVTLVGERAKDVNGRIEREAGEAPRLVVRGPLWWQVAQPDEEGRFHLSGLRPYEEIRAYSSSYGGGDRPFFSMPGVAEIPLRVAAANEEKNGPVPFPIRCVDGSGSPLEGLPVWAVEQTNGRVYFAVTSGDPGYVGRGATLLSLPRGTYSLRVGSAFSRFRAEQTVEIDAGRSEPLDVRCVEVLRSTARVDASGVPEGAQVRLVCDGFFIVATIEEVRRGHVAMPREDPVGIHVTAEGITRVSAFAEHQSGGRSAFIAWPVARVVRIVFPRKWSDVVLTSDDGVVFWEETADEEGLVLRTHAKGRLRFTLTVYRDGEETVAVPLVVDVKQEGDTELVVHAPRIERRGLEVVLPDGRPAAHAEIEVGDGEGTAPEQLDDGGRAASAWFRDGTSVTIRSPGCLPLRERLKGDGPYKPAYGAAAVRVEFAGERGERLDGVLYLDGDLIEIEGGGTRIRGLKPGRHVLIAGSRGRTGRVWQGELGEGEVRDLRFELAPRAGR